MPLAPIRELRDLTRYRKSLIQERTRAANRLHKVLEDAGIKLATVATDILGASGRAMLNALVQGTTNADVLADLARGRLRAKLPALRQALVGRFRPHHAFLVTQVLAHLDYLDEAIAGLSQQLETLLAASADALARLDTIPGVNRRTAQVLVAELGMDMTIFPSAAHCGSWAGLCPGNNESAGKHKSGKTQKGDPWLRAALVEAALGAIHTRGCALAARYRRIMRHRGHKKAVVAVASIPPHATRQEMRRPNDGMRRGAFPHDYPARIGLDRVARAASSELPERQVSVEKIPNNLGEYDRE